MPRLAGGIEVRGRDRAAVQRDDDRPGAADLGQPPRHRDAVGVDDAGGRDEALGWRHASVRNRMTPLGVRPPELTTATRAPGTCRSPPSPRSWTIASWTSPMPWVRPCESWPPWVFSGSTPSRAMFFPPSRKSLDSPIPQKPSASIQDRQLNV